MAFPSARRRSIRLSDAYMIVKVLVEIANV
jgi:hypothetical protein